MANRYKIVEGSIKRGACSKCEYDLRPFHGHVVKVVDTKTGNEEWRCNKHVRSLSSELAHKLTMLDLEDIKSVQK